MVLNQVVTGAFPNAARADGLLGEVIARCTNLDPQQRYSNVRELDAALAALPCRRAAPPRPTARTGYPYPLYLVPGFRSGSGQKALAAVAAAFWFFVFAAAGYSTAAGDPVECLIVTGVLAIPVGSYVLVFDLFGIQRHIPILNKAQGRGMRIAATAAAVDVYKRQDRALSAKTADRPEFQRMIKDSAKGLFAIVLVWKLDRFSRDRYDSAHYKHILKKNGVKVVSAKEHISDGPEGIILESMLEGYAEFYSAELSEKIHRGQKENALKGKNNGGGIPLGYLLDKQTQKLVVDPETAPLVVEIFERYSEGATVRSIIEDFNSRGLTTKRVKPVSYTHLNKKRALGFSGNESALEIRV